MKKATKLIMASFLFLGLISAFFFFLTYGIEKDSRKITLEEVNSADLSTTIVFIHSGICELYPNRLYTPQDIIDRLPQVGDDSAMYGTYRIVLSLPAGKTYGITGHTSSYAQRVYINGELLNETGNVTDNAQTFVPRTDYFTVYFTPQTDETEIIAQMAHFNNKNGYFNGFSLAEQQLIVRSNRLNFLSDGLTVGTLFAFAVFFSGMFLFYPEKKHLLWFALVCFCSGLYFFVFQSKDINAFIQNLPWAISHKLEYLSVLGSYVLFVTYVFSMLKVKVPKWQLVTFWVPVSGVILYYAIAPSTVYSYYQQPIFVYCLAVLAGTVCAFGESFHKKLYKHKENALVLFSLAEVIVLCAVDLSTHRTFNLSPFATILAVFFNAVAITMKFSRTEQELNSAMLREQEIKETNAILARMSELKNDFLHNIAHEMKTPLTVMSGYAQLTDWQLKEGKTDGHTAENLKTISEEAKRLSDMVARLSELAFDNELLLHTGRVSVSSVLNDCCAVCRPVLQKNKNVLTVECQNELYAHANGQSIIQVLINLVINSNKHTNEGSIKIKVNSDNGFAVFTIEDTGTGISPTVLPHIFEKGVSTDNGSGLGLAISKEIIEANGGSIGLVHTGTDGTCFGFTIPLWKGE